MAVGVCRVGCAGYGAGDVQRAGGGRGKVSVSAGLRPRPVVTQHSDTNSDGGGSTDLQREQGRAATLALQCDIVSCVSVAECGQFPRARAVR